MVEFLRSHHGLRIPSSGAFDVRPLAMEKAVSRYLALYESVKNIGAFEQ
jgi:hypothetical protein